MAFPYHEIPDGAVFAPHHYIYGLLLTLLVLAVVWDNFRAREPLLAALGVVVGLFGFLLVWPWYPVAGAVLSLAGPPIIVLAVGLGWSGLAVGDTWDDYPLRWRLAAMLGALVAAEDVLQHAFGWSGPFDTIWKVYLVDRVGLTAVVLLAIAVGVVVLGAVYADPENPNRQS